MIKTALAIAALAGGGVPPQHGHTLDLRTMSDALGRTEISFCSRPSPDAFGFPGHAFVSFLDESEAASPKLRIVGHTTGPTAPLGQTAWTYFNGAAVSGRQAEERYSHMKQACMTVVLDRDDYRRAVEAARPTLTAIGMTDREAASLERYTLNGNDCIDFVIRIARTLGSSGLNVPARRATDLPASYLSRLAADND
jgi:hypothetical protein